jgi:hypothetical protein
MISRLTGVHQQRVRDLAFATRQMEPDRGLGHSTVRLTLDRYGHRLPSLDEGLGRRA